jgi:structural maintenance of chromosome 2
MGNEIKQLEHQSTELSKVLVRDTSAWQHKKEALDSEKKSLGKMSKSLADLQKAQDSNKSKVEKASSSIATITSDLAQCTEKLADLQRQRQALQAGCEANCAEGDKTLAEQLMDAKTKVTTCETELRQLQMKVDHYKAQLAEKQKGAKSAGKEYSALQAEHSKATMGVERNRAELSQVPFDPAAQEALQRDIALELRVVHDLREAVDALSAQVANYEVKYQAPYPGFDGRKVKGIVASLVHLRQPDTAMALEVACGAKLFQLVVSDEVTGKEILSKGQLRKRVTIIPLNKIDGSVVSDSSMRNAHRAVGADRASLALELVGYEQEVEAAMRYVFGRTIVCKDVEAAKACAFSEGIRVRSVTLEGDLFDPAGTLTGGSRAPASNSILARFAELAEKQGQLAEHEQRLAAMQSELNKMRASAER